MWLKTTITPILRLEEWNDKFIIHFHEYYATLYAGHKNTIQLVNTLLTIKTTHLYGIKFMDGCNTPNFLYYMKLNIDAESKAEKQVIWMQSKSMVRDVW